MLILHNFRVVGVLAVTSSSCELADVRGQLMEIYSLLLQLDQTGPGVGDTQPQELLMRISDSSSL